MTTQIGTAPQTFTFTSQVDQAPIFARKWLPSAGNAPRSAVQITHGIAEHGGRYDRFARYLAGQGYVVYAIDLRGHGHTAGPDNLGKAGATAWDDMTADIKQLSDIARSEYPGTPLIAFGHSMGSALTQSHIQNHGNLLAGAILCGTMGAMPGIDETQYQDAIAQLRELATGDQANQPSQIFGGLLMTLNAPFVDNVPNPTGCEWQTSDPEEIRLFLNDPLCGKPFSNAMTHSVLQGFHDLWRENESRIPVDLPLLIIAGTEDPVGAKTTTIQALITRYMTLGHLTLDYRFYPGGRHEILNEPEKDRVHRDIGHWLSQILDD